MESGCSRGHYLYIDLFSLAMYTRPVALSDHETVIYDSNQSSPYRKEVTWAFGQSYSLC